MPLYPEAPAPSERGPRRILYASPVGRGGKRNLSKVIHRFGHREFDYLIFVYDGTAFPEPVFRRCTFIHEKGILCQFLKKYLPPDFCRKYDYVFPWVDDIDIGTFSYERFLDIFERNRLELAQPALSRWSTYSQPLTLARGRPVGRLTDFVDFMVAVYTGEAWARYWSILEADRNPWGWGYHHFLGSVCGIRRMGIVDCETVTHLYKNSWRTSAPADKEATFEKYRGFERARRQSIGELV